MATHSSIYSSLENSHGQRSLAGYSPQSHKESDMTEPLSFHFHVHETLDVIMKPSHMFTHLFSSTHTGGCFIQVLYILNAVQVQIQAILNSCIKQDNLHALQLIHLFGRRLKFICPLKLQIAVHSFESLLKMNLL